MQGIKKIILHQDRKIRTGMQGKKRFTLQQNRKNKNLKYIKLSFEIKEISILLIYPGFCGSTELPQYCQEVSIVLIYSGCPGNTELQNAAIRISILYIYICITTADATFARALNRGVMLDM